MQLDVYQEFTNETDHTPRAGIEGIGYLLLGLFGEVGSLLSALKRKQRDKGSLFAYKDSVIEEFGDALWYFSNIAYRVGLKLTEVANNIPDGQNGWAYSGVENPGSFIDLQKKAARIPKVSDEDIERYLLSLAGKVGLLVEEYNCGYHDKDRISANLIKIFPAILASADIADVSLDQAAHRNQEKAYSRWPIHKEWGALYDEDNDPDEQIPRLIEMVFKEKTIEKKAGKTTYVIQQCKGINIGDRLTDNRTEPDDYRFHDVFHMAYAAFLGWSPVLRALFKVKRKSIPETDENQDGARAIIIEEGIATWIFNQGHRYGYFENVDSLDYPLLKAVQELVQGYEVDDRPLWQWERAILEGFRIFREIRHCRGGTVTADLLAHTINFQSPPS